MAELRKRSRTERGLIRDEGFGLHLLGFLETLLADACPPSALSGRILLGVEPRQKGLNAAPWLLVASSPHGPDGAQRAPRAPGPSGAPGGLGDARGWTVRRLDAPTHADVLCTIGDLAAEWLLFGHGAGGPGCFELSSDLCVQGDLDLAITLLESLRGAARRRDLFARRRRARAGLVGAGVRTRDGAPIELERLVADLGQALWSATPATIFAGWQQPDQAFPVVTLGRP